jgi:hypothetical protein
MMDSHAMKSHVLVFVAYGQEGAKNYPRTHATTFGIQTTIFSGIWATRPVYSEVLGQSVQMIYAYHSVGRVA